MKKIFLAIFQIISLIVMADGTNDNIAINDIINKIIITTNGVVFQNISLYEDEIKYFKKIDNCFSNELLIIKEYVEKKGTSFINENPNFNKIHLNENENYILLKIISYSSIYSYSDIERILKVFQKSRIDFIYYKALELIKKIENPELETLIIDNYKNTWKINEKFDLAIILINNKIQDIDFILDDFIKLKENISTPFLFFSIGDSTIPFLREKLKSNDITTQKNSIGLLGALLDFDSYNEMKKIYLSTFNFEIKLELLGVMELLAPDIKENEELINYFENEIKTFKEEKLNLKRKNILNILKENLKLLENTKKEAKKFKKLKKYDKKKFQEEYNKLFESYGENGDLNIIKENSSIEDETQLRKLKSRFVRGFIDRYIEDYNTINEIIRFNRLIKEK